MNNNNPLSISDYSKLIGIPEEELNGRSRVENITIARQVYWYILNKKGYHYRSISQIAGRAPSTVFHGINSIKCMLETNHPLIQKYKKIIQN